MAIALLLGLQVQAQGQDPDDGPRPGDVIEDHGVAVVVPMPGEAVGTEAIFEDGSSQQLAVETKIDGNVIITNWGSESAGSPSSEGGTEPSITDNDCTDSAYVQWLHKWYTTYAWYYRSSSTPSYLSASGVEEALKTGIKSNTQAYNGCGFADNVSATHSYQGRTTSGANITSDAKCGTSDGKSVMVFGPLPTKYLAYMCWWAKDTGKTWLEATAADVKFDETDRWHTIYPESVLCYFEDPQPWSLTGVIAHEGGHVFGLDHVTEADHPWLTMSTKHNGRCQSSEVTLGRGDILGLEQKY